MIKPLLIFGTRPEAIKMAPVVLACQQVSELDPIICLTGQHRQMLDQVNGYFGIEAHEDLQVMAADQSLCGLTLKCLEGIDRVLQHYKPDCVVAQGDTTTVMASAMAAFYRRIPFIHVEAGLRTGNLYAPWPEEYNRRVVGVSADVHCCPTGESRQNLLREHVNDRTIHVTGNTVIDALLFTVAAERENAAQWNDRYSDLGDRPVVLITGHRRENFGDGMRLVCESIRQLATLFPETEFVYPVHLNPNVRQPVHEILSNLHNIHLIEPLPYPEFVWLMDRSHVILTDSGGVQEEAPSLRKPILVMRETTERPEALAAGAVELVGTSPERIVTGVSRLLTDEVEYARRQIATNPYGDGKASQRIASLIQSRAWNVV